MAELGGQLSCREYASFDATSRLQLLSFLYDGAMHSRRVRRELDRRCVETAATRREVEAHLSNARTNLNR